MPSKKAIIYHASSSEETKRLGEEFAAEVFRAKRGVTGVGARSAGAKPHATVIALTGDLGAGKTTFIQGFLHGAGIRRRAPSPTFVILRHYKVPRPKRCARAFADIHHMDAYRLKGVEQLAVLGFEKLAEDPASLILIEWGERIKRAIPRDAIWIMFGYGKKEGERKVSIKRPTSYL